MITDAELRAIRNAAAYTVCMTPGGRRIASKENPPKAFLVLDENGKQIVRVPLADALRAAREMDAHGESADVGWFVEMCKPKNRKAGSVGS